MPKKKCNNCKSLINTHDHKCPNCNGTLKSKMGCLSVIKFTATVFLSLLVLSIAVSTNELASSDPSKRQEPKSKSKTRKKNTTILKIQKLPAQKTDKNHTPDPRIKNLLQEFDDIKYSDSFDRYGFGIGGPHNQWLVKVKKLSNDKSLDLDTISAAGDLTTYGLKCIRIKEKNTPKQIAIRKLLRIYITDYIEKRSPSYELMDQLIDEIESYE